MENELGCASANITQMAKIVKNVCHSTMMHRGAERHQKMCTNASVSSEHFSFVILQNRAGDACAR